MMILGGLLTFILLIGLVISICSCGIAIMDLFTFFTNSSTRNKR